MPNPETADQLRPSSFADFVGQNALRRNLDIHIRAAIAEERPLEHFLLVGAPGMGKTSLATVIAAQLGDNLVRAKMPLPDKALERIFRNFAGGVLFLDEIHNAPNRQQEQLMPVLEEGYFPTRSGQKILLPWITVIAATTEAQHVIPALYGRFDQVPAVEEYSPEEMTQIVQHIAERVRLTLSDEDAAALARAGGGNPRRARQLVRNAKAFYSAEERLPTVAEALQLSGVDPDGLTFNHQAYLQILGEMGGGPVGLKTLSTLLRLHDTVVRDLERLLFRQGLIELHPTGRELTPTGANRIGDDRPVRPIRQIRKAS